MREGEFQAKNGARITVRRAAQTPSDIETKRNDLNKIARSILSKAQK